MMIRNCSNCKFKDRDSRQEPCSSCIKTMDRLYFKPKTKQKLECKWGIDNIVYTNNGGYAKPTITFEGIGYIEKYSGGITPDDIRDILESKLNGHDDSVDAYTYTINSDVIKSYCEHDVKVNRVLGKKANIMICDEVIAWKHPFDIKKVIFNDPATIVMWTDGTKTVVKAQDEGFDPEKGLAMAITKKALGNKGNYFDEIKKWTEPYYEEQAKKEPEFNLFEFLTNPNGSFSITFTSDDKEITLNDVVMSKKGEE